MNEYREIATPSRTKEILLKHGFSLKRSLGQNFLTEPNILRKIVETAQIDERASVIEARPGIGALTEQLVMHAKQVVAFETDDRLIPVLADTVQPYDDVTIIHRDILKMDLSTVIRETSHEELPLRVVANLPYYITTPITTHFLELDLVIDGLVAMMQKGVVDRISAEPETKAYGSLSTAVQYYMEASLVFIIPKAVFVPQPDVDSAILKLTRGDTPAVEATDEKTFFRLAKAAFQQRRKALWDNLQHSYGKDDQTKTWSSKNPGTARADPKRRGETLSLQELTALSNAMSEDRQ